MRNILIPVRILASPYGHCIALWLVEEMNDGSDMSLVKVPKMFSCISIARATKSDMVFILNMIC